MNKILRNLLLTGLLLSAVFRAEAAPAQIVLKGTVIGSDNNTPLIGVAVHLKENPKIYTLTDAGGNYELKVPDDKGTVVFEALGYDTKELSVKDGFLFSLVTMILQENMLDEVVVVGFGTQKKESMVGAVQSVRSEDLLTTSSSLTSSFAGNVPGLISMRSSGEPGLDQATFYVRGVGTFGNDANPMVVIDGVETTSAAMVNMIAPESIESFSVLKDATATALYGSRGANGVIIINTKEGRNAEKMSISVNFDTSVSTPTFLQPVASGPTYMEQYNEALYNDARFSGIEYEPRYTAEKIDGTRRHLNPYIYPENDWYHLIFKDYAVSEHLNLSVRGGGKKVNYFMNAAIFNEGSIFAPVQSNLVDAGMYSRKIQLQSNVAAMITRTTKLSMRLNCQFRFRGTPAGEVSDYFVWTMKVNPVYFPAVLPGEDGDTFLRFGNDASWNMGGASDIARNPYATYASGAATIHHMFMTAVIQADQNLDFITKGLSARASATFYNYSYAKVTRQYTPFYYKIDDGYYQQPDGSFFFTTTPIGPDGSTYLSYSAGDTGHHRYSVLAQLSYKRKFGKTEITSDAVYRMNEKMNNANSASENDLLPFREQGIAARLTLNYDKRYLAEANFGYNGSENFLAGKRFGLFPSVAVGWTPSNEKFWAPLKKTVSLLKVRASYGLVGNDSLASRFPYLTRVSMASRSYVFGNTFKSVGAGYITTYGNEDATWELARKLDVGVDLQLFKSLDLTIDWFREHRSNIFMKRNSIAAVSGLGSTLPYANIGKMDNGGVDMSLSYKKVFRKDFTATLRGAFTYAHNEIVYNDEPDYSLTPNLSKIGHPQHSRLLYVSEGLFTSQEEVDAHPTQTFGNYGVGDIKYADITGPDGKPDGVVNALDRVRFDIPSVPEIQYGFGGGLTYRNFDCNVMFQGSARVTILMSGHHPFSSNKGAGYNIMQYIVDDHWSWDNNRADAAYPRLSTRVNNNNTQSSSYFLRDGSFLRLKNVEVGYTFRKKIRLYINGTDLLTFTPFKYWDPEMGSGSGLEAYPLQKTARLGIQFNF